MDPRTGGCRCGRLRYELTGELGFTFHWSPSSGEPAIYVTPQGSIRHFCGRCASPVCNHPREPELLCLVVASLDDELDVAPCAHLNTESKAPWFEIADALPQFAAFPTAAELRGLRR